MKTKKISIPMKATRKATLFLLFSLFLIIGFFLDSCSKMAEEININKLESFETVAQGRLSSNSIFSKENRVITNSSSWTSLIKDIKLANPYMSVSFLDKDIDFNKYTCIAAFDVLNSTTSIDIISITEKKESIEVGIKHLQLGLTQDVAHPFHIIKIIKTTKKIEFNYLKD